MAGIELGYLGACVGRPSPVALPWEDDGSVWQSADMWATPDQSREYLLGLYRRAWQPSDESLASRPLRHRPRARRRAPGPAEYVGRIQAAADPFRP
ncbi:MAG TPA: DUF664 domain-containing protein [Nocardioides sp.]|jgi:hypothetical protein|uniref:mycothiol transferase n=1 Tax=Nocardioides sp. TaxID=35761 RepID=UPI002E2EE263|nr:DUF664 domain-containing protein [Nocardioides sp.]HEX3932202.1 DUF664 domain-containing protein [Nocardioides sp.]